MKRLKVLVVLLMCLCFTAGNSFALKSHNGRHWAKSPGKYTHLITCNPGEVIHIKIRSEQKPVRFGFSNVFLRGTSNIKSSGASMTHSYTYRVPNKKPPKSQSHWQYRLYVHGPVNGGYFNVSVW